MINEHIFVPFFSYLFQLWYIKAILSQENYTQQNNNIRNTEKIKANCYDFVLHVVTLKH